MLHAMKKFEIKYVDNGQDSSYCLEAKNRSCARLAFRAFCPESTILSISEVVPMVQKVLQEAVAQGNVRLGVQKSLQLGFGDLPLFAAKNEQTSLF